MARKNKTKSRIWWLLLFAIAIAGIAIWSERGSKVEGLVKDKVPQENKFPDAGDIVEVVSTQSLTVDQATAISRQNYGASAPKPKSGVTKALIKYTSYDEDGEKIVVYGRAYVPQNGSKLPIMGFAPGTTGIGDQCASSLEQPQVKNWANYESHMVTYAGQGYAAFITDYEGMRDPSRIHHYMNGELEGRAVIDGVRALENWNPVKNRLDDKNIFLAGFSQGGHAVMWADKISPEYAPNVDIKGVVGFGPVSDVERTLTDVTKGANINWFGPYVLTSYQDIYNEQYPIEQLLSPRWAPSFEAESQAHCIDNLIAHFGKTPQGVYTPEFIADMSDGKIDNPQYADFARDLRLNAVGDQKTTTAKRIIQGGLDNVVLPAQQDSAFKKICSNSKGPAELKIYPTATHYNVMVQSFFDNLGWMESLRAGKAVQNSCK